MNFAWVRFLSCIDDTQTQEIRVGHTALSLSFQCGKLEAIYISSALPYHCQWAALALISCLSCAVKYCAVLLGTCIFPWRGKAMIKWNSSSSSFHQHVSHFRLILSLYKVCSLMLTTTTTLLHVRYRLGDLHPLQLCFRSVEYFVGDYLSGMSISLHRLWTIPRPPSFVLGIRSYLPFVLHSECLVIHYLLSIYLSIYCH